MSDFSHEMTGPIGVKAALGLIVLQADETIEQELRRLIFDPEVSLYVSRVPSGLKVTRETLTEMDGTLTSAAALFPRAVRFDAVGYGCTSGASVIGGGKVADLIREGCETAHVTDPLSAVVAQCRDKGLSRLALLSPYVEDVNEGLRKALAEEGIETPVFGSFGVAEEARVARISPNSVWAAATKLADRANVDGMFLSCTNLRTADVLAGLTQELEFPVMSSNRALAWHMCRLAGLG